MIKLTTILSLTLLIISCKKELPNSILPGKYVWVHSYNSEFESESFQTIDTTYSVKIKRSGVYTFFKNDEVIASGKFDGDDSFRGLPTYYNGGSHYASGGDDKITIWSYPIIDHNNTFLKL